MKRKLSVWVPFECFPDGTEKKCNDLPRFALQKEVREYIQTHGQQLAARQLQWREHFEKEYFDEYQAGVGTLRILLRG
jgi:hypothetical protein